MLTCQFSARVVEKALQRLLEEEVPNQILSKARRCGLLIFYLEDFLFVPEHQTRACHQFSTLEHTCRNNCDRPLNNRVDSG